MDADRYQGFAFDPADLAEDVDLTPEVRKEILFVHGNLTTWNHFEVLGLAWNAPGDAARAAYFEKVKVFHPDRYPGKRLGKFRSRIEQIFRRLTEARDTLQDAARRSEYLRNAAPPEEFARAEILRIESEQRGQERRARLVRTNPVLARAQQLADLIGRGKQAMEAGRFSQAANDFLTAASMDPRNAEAKQLAGEAKKRAEEERGREAYDRGLAAEAMGNWSRALDAYKEARATDPRNGRYAIQAARAALQVGDLNAARELADAAVAMAERSAAAHEVRGAVLAALDDKREAKRALERALELDPNLTSARERLKKLRWSLFG